ncbi:uncharacterized protein K489DRAFT_56791 [Dissoconium aciculare CBS 342.82]|uniref:Uncharacterized protein n=1 Tax=Dissoconium aciculare CBS 342.82 TaxID=1314786 RepID=A0A6J3LYJ7_9PEZI|nr:uncharacterized protein K489DRAFT_56791 [Dissoconium aciculare CBS 342.82]KAF1819702.1 hypothetical protein K489DRAFT_56791 [Dissoconium aciculare CBS 342.82]
MTMGDHLFPNYLNANFPAGEFTADLLDFSQFLGEQITTTFDVGDAGSTDDDSRSGVNGEMMPLPRVFECGPSTTESVSTESSDIETPCWETLQLVVAGRTYNSQLNAAAADLCLTRINTIVTSTPLAPQTYWQAVLDDVMPRALAEFRLELAVKATSSIIRTAFTLLEDDTASLNEILGTEGTEIAELRRAISEAIPGRPWHERQTRTGRVLFLMAVLEGFINYLGVANQSLREAVRKDRAAAAALLALMRALEKLDQPQIDVLGGWAAETFLAAPTEPSVPPSNDVSVTPTTTIQDPVESDACSESGSDDELPSPSTFFERPRCPVKSTSHATPKVIRVTDLDVDYLDSEPPCPAITTDPLASLETGVDVVDTVELGHDFTLFTPISGSGDIDEVFIQRKRPFPALRTIPPDHVDVIYISDAEDEPVTAQKYPPTVRRSHRDHNPLVPNCTKCHPQDSQLGKRKCRACNDKVSCAKRIRSGKH